MRILHRAISSLIRLVFLVPALIAVAVFGWLALSAFSAGLFLLGAILLAVFTIATIITLGLGFDTIYDPWY